jgi:hypothetical protein
MPLENIIDDEPESIRKLKATLSKLETIEGRNAGLSFVPTKNDVIIATTAKSGTTLCQVILHSLRTGGDMSYDEISLVIPCIEMAYDYGVKDLSTWPQGDFSPRAFKTHLWYRDCPKWCQGEDQHNRVIFVCRDPLDAAPSFYHFFNGWFFDYNEISMKDFVTHFCLRRGAAETSIHNASHWHTIASWYPHRNQPWMLWLHYEDLIEDLPACIDLIADFMGGEAASDPERRKIALQQAQIDFMKRHSTKYDEHMLKLARNEACGRPKYAGLGENGTGKVRDGGVGKGRGGLGEQLKREMQEKWEEVMLPVTGYATYCEMRNGINEELGRP